MIEPFEGYLVRPERASRVVSPSYDSLTADERRQYMEEHPDSFLHVTRSPLDADIGRTPLELARANAAHLRRILTEGNYERLDPALYLYRLERGDHAQTAIVGDIPLDRYDDGTIRPHERTNVDREDQLALHLEVVAASSSPVAMAYRDDELAGRVDQLCESPPRLDFTSPGELRQQIWRIDEPDVIAELGERLGGPLYVTDGHHRLAAAARMRGRMAEHGDGDARDYVLVSLFPHSRLRTFGYHRVVQTEYGCETVLERLEGIATLEHRAGPPASITASQGQFAMFCDDRWFDVRLVGDNGGIDAARLQVLILGPVFGIDAPTSDPRLSYLPGTAGLDALARACHDADAVGFAVAGLPVEQVMAEADHGRVLPPKSTFFSPKPRSGVFVRLR